ncbi:MAG: DUF308 domain-containing protein [Candidatus Nanopelagicales bacterium]|jgi:uncharacterized membrane protein HdeD (DUF308 family)
MTTVEVVDVDDVETSFRQHWGLMLFLGIVTLVVGAIMLFWPGKTVIVVAWLVAIWLVVSGVFQIIRGFRRGLSGGMRALLFISGGLSLILGLIAMGGSYQAADILAILVGISFLFAGFEQLFSAGESREGRGWRIFGGIVMLIGGFVVLLWPGISLATLAWVLGIWLVIGGIFWIIAAFSLRSAAKRLASA